MELVGEDRFDHVARFYGLTSRFGLLRKNLVLRFKLLQKLSVGLEVPEELFFCRWKRRADVPLDAHGFVHLATGLFRPFNSTLRGGRSQGCRGARGHAA